MGAPLGDFPQFWTAFLYQFRSYLRTWRFVGLVIFVAIIAGAIFAVQAHNGVATVTTVHPDASDELSTYLALVVDASILTGALLGGDALAVDLQGGPGYLMLTQPVRRRTLFAGRFAAAAVTGCVVISVYYLFAAGVSEYFYQTIPGALAVSLGLAFLFILATLAVAFFFSSFFRSPTVGIVASVLILLLAFPTLTSVGTLGGVEPWFSLDYGSTAIVDVLMSNFVHESVQHLSLGKKGGSLTIYSWYPYPWEGAVIMAAYLVGFLVVSYVIYRYKEVKG